jgi:methyltransferase (TIGR00027 family)
MKPDEASQTAIISAAFRAAHAYFYSDPAIHDDTFALRLSGFEDAEQLRQILEAGGIPALPAVSAFFALRHRFSEELLIAAVKDGVDQIVLLGAGLDSFALRHPDIIGNLRFFELDHPNTQSWKLDRIAELGLARPDINYLTIDFQAEDIKDILIAGGVDFAQQVFFSWLGVTQYIDNAAAARTLGLVTEGGPGSQIVFDFIVAPEELDEHHKSINKFFADGSASRGEPWINTYSPEALVRELRDIGFRRADRLTPEDAGHRYYRDQPANVVPMQGWQLMHATT